MRYDVDDTGKVRGLYTQILRETEDGTVMEDGPERFWPADLVILSIGFIGTEITIPQSFGIKTERNKIVANDKDFRTNHSKIFAAGDARRGPSLVVWAIKEGRAVADAVETYLNQEILV